MYSFVFKEKLKKLNSNLYVKDEQASEVVGGRKTSGIFYRKARRSDFKSDYNYLTAEARAWLSADESGNTDRHVTGVPTDWIPEYDQFNIEDGRIIAKGWRTLVMFLVKEGFCTLEKARKVFSSSLGEHTFDRVGYDGKLAIARKEAGWKSEREKIAATWGI